MQSERKRTVLELVAVDGLAAGAVALGEVAALAHELGDHAVERAALEVQGLALAAHALLAGAERAEVLGGLGHHVGGEGHLDAARGGAADGHVEENNLLDCGRWKVEGRAQKEGI